MSLFSDAQHQFLAISEEDGDIETLPFLLACRQFIPFLDTLGPTAFAPVKADISGNIERLMTKYETDKSSYDTLQKIVDDEISKNFQKDPTSCTIGLLWLNRGLSFIYHFLQSVTDGERDLVKCCYNSYEKTLKKFHGWLIRSVFTVAVYAAPYYEDFMASLKTKEGVTDEEVIRDILSSISNFKINIDKVFKLLTARSIDIENTY